MDIVPGDSQLWVTTHSLGVLRAAQEMETDAPGSTCILDFDGVDPDTPTELRPVTVGRVSWEKLLSITLDDMSERVAPRVVLICEGSSVGTRRRDFDSKIYDRILGWRVPGVVFVSGGSSHQVQATGRALRDALGHILPATKIVSLVDRDDRSAAEVAQLESGSTIVLSERNLESYLFADDVIEALVESVQKKELLDDALRIKQDALANSIARGNAADDLKSAAGEMYTQLKTLLGLQRCGNDKDAFMRDTLAPLVVPGMATYKKLKSDVVDRIL